jgi:hypothetical protein
MEQPPPRRGEASGPRAPKGKAQGCNHQTGLCHARFGLLCTCTITFIQQSHYIFVWPVADRCPIHVAFAFAFARCCVASEHPHCSDPHYKCLRQTMEQLRAAMGFRIIVSLETPRVSVTNKIGMLYRNLINKYNELTVAKYYLPRVHAFTSRVRDEYAYLESDS